MSGSLDTFAGSAKTRPGASISSRSRALSKSAAVRAHIRTFAPSRRNARLISNPSPWLAPVIPAVFPLVSSASPHGVVPYPPVMPERFLEMTKRINHECRFHPLHQCLWKQCPELRPFRGNHKGVGLIQRCFGRRGNMDGGRNFGPPDWYGRVVSLHRGAFVT